MKLLINIDQKGSIAAGLEAPHSTETFELPIADVPESLRKWLSDNYNLKSGEVKASAQRNPSGWCSDYGDWSESLTLSHPLTVPRVVAALEALKRDHEYHVKDVAERLERDKAEDLSRVRAAIAAGPIRKTCYQLNESFEYDTYEDVNPKFEESREELNRAYEKLSLKYREQEALARERIVQKNKAEEKRTEEQIEALIPAEHLERYRSKMMSAAEINGYCRRAIKLEGFADYKPLSDDDLAHEEECPGDYCESTWDIHPAPDATAEQWAELQKARETYPDAVLMRQSGKYECNDGWIFGWFIRVKGLRGVYRDFAI